MDVVARDSSRLPVLGLLAAMVKGMTQLFTIFTIFRDSPLTSGFGKPMYLVPQRPLLGSFPVDPEILHAQPGHAWIRDWTKATYDSYGAWADWRRDVI